MDATHRRTRADPSLAPLTTSSWPADTSQPVLDTTVGGVLRQAAAAVPDRVGLVAAWPGTPTRRWRYAELLDEAERAAWALLGRFAPGERVAIWAPNIAEWLVLYYGTALAGLTLVTVNPASRPRELAYVLRHSGAAGLFLVEEYRGSPLATLLDEVRPELSALREVVSFAEWGTFLASGSPTERLPEVAPDAAAQVQYTSGTTGTPKGALLPHRALTNNARFGADRLGAQPGEVWLNANPLFHVAGSGLFNLGAVQRQATQVLCPFDPDLVLQLAEEERAAIVPMPPTMLDLLLARHAAHPRDLSALRVVAAGGMTVPPALVRRLEATLGVPLLIGYGQTETCGLVLQAAAADAPSDRAETLGRPLPQVELRIVDPRRQTVVPPGQVGEICVRGYTVMRGYLDLPEATAEAIDADGWLHTGDLGAMDARGYCRIAGRLKEMIIRGGENIYPREIEAVLEGHPSVAAAAVVGVPDERYGEQVAACIQVAPDHAADAAALQAFCRARLAPYKVPRRWHFLDELPRTPLGKVQKFALGPILRDAGQR